MLKPIPIDPAPDEPVGPEEAKLAARVDDDAFDDLMPGWIAAAREIAEQETGRRFVKQCWRAELRDFPCADELIPVFEPTAVAISYRGPAGDWVTMADGTYEWGDARNQTQVAPKYGTGWPILLENAIGARVRIDITSGPDDATTAKACVKEYIKALVAWWVRNPEAVADGNLQPAPFLSSMLDPVKVY